MPVAEPLGDREPAALRAGRDDERGRIPGEERVGAPGDGGLAQHDTGAVATNRGNQYRGGAATLQLQASGGSGPPRNFCSLRIERPWAAMLLMVALPLFLLFSIDFDPSRLNTDTGADRFAALGVLKFLIAVAVIGVGVGYLVTTRNRLRIPKLLAAFGSCVAMVAFVALPFLAWLLLGISTWFAISASIALCSITAFALTRYLLRATTSAAISHTPES